MDGTRKRLGHGALPTAMMVVAAASFVARSARAQTYYIDETTDWTGNGCEAEDLPAVTAGIKANLDSRGWKGSRYLNVNAWPQDIVESCDASYGANGDDASFGDGADLLVEAGHGNTGFVAFGYQRNGMCTVDLGRTSNVSSYTGAARLGQMDGARASIAMWLDCCTLKPASLTAHANYQWVKQQVGFGGIASFDADMVGAFVRNSGAPARTGEISNVDAWLIAMEDKPGWFTGDNAPIVVSYGTTAAEAAGYDASLSLGSFQSPRTGGATCGSGPRRFYYTYTWKDHGSAGCN